MFQFGVGIPNLSLQTITKNGSVVGVFLRTSITPVEGIGHVLHGTILYQQRLSTEDIVRILKDGGYQVLTGEELDSLVEGHAHILPHVPLRALGSHFKEGGKDVERCYHRQQGSFMKGACLYSQDPVPAGWWFSCKVI